MAKCYKLRYINKIKLFFEFQKGMVSTPEPPSPPWVRHLSGVSIPITGEIDCF